MGYGLIKHFTDIEAWKVARKLRVAVYKEMEDRKEGRGWRSEVRCRRSVTLYSLSSFLCSMAPLREVINSNETSF